MEHRVYDPTIHLPTEVIETVQWRGQTVTRVRKTLQDPLKLGRELYLSGETVMQKLESLKQLAALESISQLDLLEYIQYIMDSPLVLETVPAEDVDVN